MTSRYIESDKEKKEDTIYTRTTDILNNKINDMTEFINNIIINNTTIQIRNFCDTCCYIVNGNNKESDS